MEAETVLGSSNLAVYSPDCVHCPIYKSHGYGNIHNWGNPKPSLMVIGEYPSEEDVTQGRFLVGKGGQLLQHFMKLSGIPIEEVLFTSTVRCAPRDIAGEVVGTNEVKGCVEACLGNLKKEILMLRPKVILAVGAVAAQALLGKKITLKQWRGRNLPLNLFTPTWIMWDIQCWVVEHKATPPFEIAWGDETQFKDVLEWAKSMGYEPPQIPAFVTYKPSYVLRQDNRHMDYSYLNEDMCNSLTQTSAGQMVINDLRIVRDEMHYKGIEVKLDDEEEKDYEWINTPEELETYVDEVLTLYRAGSIDRIAVDIEHSRVDGAEWVHSVGLMNFTPITEVTAVILTHAKNQSRVVRVFKGDSKFTSMEGYGLLSVELKRLLKEVPVVGQNFVFDSHILRNYLGVTDINFYADTMLMHHWLKVGKNNGLDFMGSLYCQTGGHKREMDLALAALPPEERSWKNTDDDVFFRYSAADGDITLQLSYILEDLIKKEGRWDHYLCLMKDHGVWELVRDMQYCGMKLDPDAWRELCIEFPSKMFAILDKLDISPILERFYTEKCNAYNADMLKRKKENKVLKLEDFKKEMKTSKGRKVYKNRFNPKSPKQTKELWKIMEIPIDKIPKIGKTKGGDLSTNEDNRDRILNSLRKWNQASIGTEAPTDEGPWQAHIEVINTIAEYISLQTLHSMYIKSMPAFVPRGGVIGSDVDSEVVQLTDDITNTQKFTDISVVSDIADIFVSRLKKSSLEGLDDMPPHIVTYGDMAPFGFTHPSFMLSGTDTGRLSCNNPNVQQLTALVKKLYCSRWKGQGGVFLVADYSQMEVRIMVMLANDEGLREAINQGRDVHNYTASMVFGVDENNVPPKLRQRCKAVTFGLLYGMGVPGLAAQLNISNREAADLVEKFFAQMPAVRKFVEDMENFCHQHGYVETIFGRRRPLPDIHSSESWLQAEAERRAVNTPVQSAASDFTAMSAGRIWKDIRERGYEVFPLSLVHDSFMVDTKPRHILDLMGLFTYQMVEVPQAIYPWCNVTPAIDFEIGAGYGGLMPASLEGSDLVVVGKKDKFIPLFTELESDIGIGGFTEEPLPLKDNQEPEFKFRVALA